MSASVARVRGALGVGRFLGWLLTIGVVVFVLLAVAGATRTDRLMLLAVAAFGGLALLISFRWPVLSLYAFAALIPIEAVLVIANLGTISKFAGLLFAVSYGVPRLGRLAIAAMPPAAWAYVGWAILSLGWALDRDAAWAELSTLLQLFVIALLVADVVVHRPTTVRPLMWVYSVSAAVTGLIGAQSFVTSGAADGGRAVALQGQDPAQFAAVLLPALVFSLFEVLNGRRLLISIPIALLTGAGVVFSGTRGAWLAVAIVIFFFLLPQVQLTKRVAAFGLLIVMLVASLQVPGVGALIAERADSALSSGGAGRTDIWSVAIKIYETSPVIGVGYANFPVAYTPDLVRSADVGAYAAGHPEGSGPHNILVGTLIEMGPMGFFLLIAFLGPLVLRRGWGPDAAVIQACLAALMTSALFLDILANRKQVWLIIGLASGLAFLARHRASTAPTGETGVLKTGLATGRSVTMPAPPPRVPGTTPGPGSIA